MKKFILMGSAIAMMLFTSCSSMEQMPQFATSQSMVQIPQFTTAQALCGLQIGATFESTTTLLGCKPYNVLSKQLDGYDIYVYKYKLVERKVESKNVDKVGYETNGETAYNGKMAEAILIYKNNKLVSLLTDDGTENSSRIVMLDNTLYAITSNKGEYIIKPEPEKKEAPATMPQLPGKK